MGHNYIKALHLIMLIVWLGGLMGLSRFLGYHVREEANVRERLTRLEKRMYYFVTMPGGIVAVLSGVMLLLGVGLPNADWGVGDFLRYYMVPSAPQNVLWRATFHAKFLCVFILLVCDFFTLHQIGALAKAQVMPSRVRFSILHGVEALCVILIIILMIAQPMARH